jgi:thioredoxin
MKTIVLWFMLVCSVFASGQTNSTKTKYRKKVKKEVVYSHLTLEEYQNLIPSDKKTIVDFNAKWCGPCKKIAPYIEKIKEELNGELLVIKIDTDKNPELAQELKIEGLPTLILYENKSEKWKNLGYLTEENLREKIKN